MDWCVPGIVLSAMLAILVDAAHCVVLYHSRILFYPGHYRSLRHKDRQDFRQRAQKDVCRLGTLQSKLLMKN